jgi:hypothetical protein
LQEAISQLSNNDEDEDYDEGEGEQNSTLSEYFQDSQDPFEGYAHN